MERGPLIPGAAASDTWIRAYENFRNGVEFSHPAPRSLQVSPPQLSKKAQLKYSSEREEPASFSSVTKERDGMAAPREYEAVFTLTNGLFYPRYSRNSETFPHLRFLPTTGDEGPLRA